MTPASTILVLTLLMAIRGALTVHALRSLVTEHERSIAALSARIAERGRVLGRWRRRS